MPADKIENVIFLLHGYGADGQDLIGLADPMSSALSNCAFIAPDAPEPCKINPVGRQWFPIPTMDGSSEEGVRVSLEKSTNILNSLVARELKRLELTEKSAILIGFSQGTMISLHYAVRHPSKFAGVIGFSGRLLAPELLEQEVVSKPPVLLIHGDADPIVPYTCLAEAVDALTAVGVSTKSYTCKGTAHGISPDGLNQAVVFVRKQLYNKAN